MFKINPNNCITAQEQILYNIMEAVQAPTKPIEPIKSTPSQLPVSIGKCAVCGREWANVGQKMACGKKHKKEGKKV